MAESILAERRVTVKAPPALERRTVRTVRVAASAPAEPPRRKLWPVLVVIALLALAGFGYWKKQRSARLEAEQAASQAAAAPAPLAAAPTAAEPAREAAASTPREDAIERFKEKTNTEFKAADTNGDGYLSPDEARRFPVLARNFQRADQNGDGRISLEEFAQARRAAIEKRLNRQK